MITIKRKKKHSKIQFTNTTYSFCDYINTIFFDII